MVKYNFKKRKSAALIIALIIVSVASMMILGVGRATISSTFISNRFGDSVIANNLAWSGIEHALYQFKTTNSLTAASFPTTLVPSNPVNLTNVYRRNVTTNAQIASVDYKNPSTWNLSEQYYDLRMSGIDDTVAGEDLAVPTHHQIYGVNLKWDGTVYRTIKKGGYYQVPSSTYRFFDLSNYQGNVGSDANQKLVFNYEVDSAASLSAANYIAVDFFVKYREDDALPADNINDNLACKPSIGGAVYTGRTGFHSHFYGTTNNRITSTAPGGFYIYTPSCLGTSIDNIVERLIVRFTYVGTATGKVSFGLRTDSDSLNYYPQPNSIIGTGVSHISSTGIFGNAKKTIEVDAVKALKFDINTSTNVQCDNAAGSTTLSNCPLKLYRDTKY